MADMTPWNGEERRGNGSPCMMHLDAFATVTQRLDDGVGQFRDLRDAQSETLALVRRIEAALCDAVDGSRVGLWSTIRDIEKRVASMEADRDAAKKAALTVAVRVFGGLLAALVACGALGYGILHAVKP